MPLKKIGFFSLLLLSFLLRICSYNLTSAHAGNPCDRAHAILTKGLLSPSEETAVQYYKEAIELCPGFIRPYELVGNWYRKNNQNDHAIEFFEKAADLGSQNYRLYYLLSHLLYQKNELDRSYTYLEKSLDLRKNYPKAVELKEKIQGKRDKEGPKIVIFEPSGVIAQ